MAPAFDRATGFSVRLRLPGATACGTERWRLWLCLTLLSRFAAPNRFFCCAGAKNASPINDASSEFACSVDLAPCRWGRSAFNGAATTLLRFAHVPAIQPTLQGRQRALLLECRREQALRRWQSGAAAGAVSGRDQ